VAVDDGAVVDVEADALGDGDAFAVAAEADEVGGVWKWCTRSTSCSMIGPASRS
jgi:hypothetical protein